MQIILNPEREAWAKLLQRPYYDNASVLQAVQTILNEVKQNGDLALKQFSKDFDSVSINEFKVTEEEMAAAGRGLSPELKDAIQQAKKNIETFHKAQVQKTDVIETMPGVQCWRKSVPIGKTGLYVPGGTAPLFSTVLMLAIPAYIAGCKEIILCTPCDKEGKIHEAILYAAKECGISNIFKIGGAQAIAAMAYGTETIPAVYKIFGPGNQYVTAAKRLVQQEGMAIDMPAGPSELCVLADENANPSFVAADLLSQAEHGTDSQVLLVSTSRTLVEKVVDQITLQLDKLPRKEIAEKALNNSRAIVFGEMDEAIELVNAYAAEHLIIASNDAEKWGDKITNAGSVFLGHYTPESVGDYASGTNHTLPTNGFAKAYSGVSVDSFVKKITFQQVSIDGLKSIMPTVTTMAEHEGLKAHAEAVRIRFN